ncbi:oligoribonuclease [Cryptococcus wingfieldii CBS 7118]|uniref:Oligoribonuclease n=1 Tax=Cryptococcus wingfieldii CBS 7118 TaxID=1295528 RepID=A0A1E3J065_9TREE|nr:oligoribonuclease [Cryptococcus wingfieldii CBS 7118]ODN94267.1 oligoribonuclease [Cryptococcus wingfieldii CBS 7118]
MSTTDALTYDDGPLVDCEMTGLDFLNDKIIEIAVIITDGRLKPVDEGVSYIINTSKEVLDGMGEWCTEQHGKTGLTRACLDSPHSYEDVVQKVLAYIQKWIPEKGAGLLAGSSVHADMRFMLIGMPEIMQHLSYRILDVSTVKEVCRRWYPTVRAKEQKGRAGEIAHRALDDIQASIKELEYYREHIFIPVESPVDAPKDEPVEVRKTAL